MDFFFYVKTHESSLFFFVFEKPISKGSKTDQFFFGSLDSKNGKMNWRIWYFRPKPPFRCSIVWHRHRFDVKIHESRIVTRFHLTRKNLMRKFAFSQQILIRWRQVTQLAYSCTRTRLHCTALTSELAWACPARLCTVTTKITMVFSTKLNSLIKLNHMHSQWTKSHNQS